MPDDPRYILGIETSCDETAAAIVERGGLVRSSIVASQNEIHGEFAGVVPELASRAHVERITPVIREALRAASLSWRDIGAVAVGHRPGLIGSLLIGVSAAKAISWSLGVPLLGVDHVHAHLYAGVLRTDDTALPHPVRFPALGLIVSGGHTSLYLLNSWTTLTRLGATIDDAMGEAFDKAAAILGLPFPGGPNLDKLAQTPGASDRACDLPVSRLQRDSLDFSFSGLKTALLYAVRGIPPSPNPRAEQPPPPLPLTPQRTIDLAASFQRAATRAAIIKLERALDLLGTGVAPRGTGSSSASVPFRATGGLPDSVVSRGTGSLPASVPGLPLSISTLLVGGGVTANSRLRAELCLLADKRGLSLALPPMPFCVDNAAMIAGLAHELALASSFADLTLQAIPTTTC